MYCIFIQEIDTVKLAANFGKLCTVPLDNILVNNIALQFFMGKKTIDGTAYILHD